MFEFLLNQKKLVQLLIFTLSLLVWGIFFIALRLALSTNISPVDAEHTFFAQKYSVSYYPSQPPLYTWLAYTMFEIFGINLASLVVLRYGLFCGSLLMLWLAARQLIKNTNLALAAVLTPLLIYTIGWESHIAHPDSILSLALVSSSFYLFLLVIKKRQWRPYLIIGQLIGLALISHYALISFIIPMIAASFIQSKTRRAICNYRFLVSLVIAFIIAYGSLSLVAGKTDIIMHTALNIFIPDIQISSDFLVTLGDLAVNILIFFAPVMILLPLVFPQGLHRLRGDNKMNFAGINMNIFFASFFVFYFLMLIFSSLSDKIEISHLVCSSVVVFPTYYLMRVDKQGFRSKQLRFLTVTSFSLLGLSTVYMASSAYIGPPLCSTCHLSYPWDRLADEIRQKTKFEHGIMSVSDQYIAANFRIRFPDAGIFSLSHKDFNPSQKKEINCSKLLVWQSLRNVSGAPKELTKLVDKDSQFSAPRYAKASHNSIENQVQTLGYMSAQKLSKNCQ